MFSTTVLIAVQMKFVKHWHALVALGFFIVFGFLDGLFWGAALKKVPHGAWVPLVIGSILYVRCHYLGEEIITYSGFFRMMLMVFWSWAKVSFVISPLDVRR